ncbi:MAG: ABC transporter substrate-binding protein [Deltaproteobacteria bacterium RBG_16_49_23]|nr:MAG: ABC transporter substrate-binding protein [Deltaproteobacteria bacterium RBG_16_49_23]
MWKKLCPILILILVGAVSISFAQEKKSKIFKIGVTQIVSHPALDGDSKGFEKALADAGFKEGVHVTYDRQNAQGDMANAQTIAQKFLDAKVNMVHSIATPTSQAVVKTIKNIPVVFSSVTDPVDAGLVPKTSPPGTKSGTNVTGVSDRWPVHLQFEMYAKFVPKAKKWGTIYNAGDANSMVHIKEMRESAKKLGLELIETTISTSAETLQAVQSLAGKGVQAINITSDNTAVSAFEAIVKVCNEKKIPLFAGDVDSVPRGAIAAYGLDYFLIGESAGKKAVQILKGTKPGDIPWGPAEKFGLVVSEKAAKAQGTVIPSDLLKKADKVIKE